ncbi:threonine/serine dehydratase [bacterium]|nr:threonine/serine dehydratase [bacterium]
MSKIKQVYQKIRPYIRETPLLYSDFLSQTTGNEVYLKCENLQVTHAFKIRGAVHKVLSMPKGQIQNKILVTASGGNHGLAVAHTARILGLDSLVYLPVTTPAVKIKAIRSVGSRVELSGNAWDESNEQAMLRCRCDDFCYIHPFDDDMIIQGQATVAYEILQQLKDADIIMASIGGGGLISGIAQYIKAKHSKIKVFGVETRGADSMAQSIHTGRIVTLPHISSKAESLGAKRVTERTFHIVRTYVDALFTVDDAEAARDQMTILNEEKLWVELASSCVVSAYQKFTAPTFKNKKVVIVLCGGNAPVDFGHSNEK